MERLLQHDFSRSSWLSNKLGLEHEADLLFQPVAVGFSYTEGQAVVNTPDAAIDVYAFLQLFMKSFPEYSANEFNIAGESYAGHYIPKYAWAQKRLRSDIRLKYSVIL